MTIALLASSGCAMAQAPADKLNIVQSYSVDALGACQGVARINGKVYLYGDREVGVIREYIPDSDTLRYTQNEILLTVQGEDLINHPTGLAFHTGLPTFIGNSIRLNAEGTKWRAVIYRVDWQGLLTIKKLDANLINTIEDDACIQGTRPEYVQYQGKWYVATSDYGDAGNQVRLYDPEKLSKASKTSEDGVLAYQFTCGPWVQNLHYDVERKVLVLIQNQIEGRKWRLTFLDLEKSIASGTQHIIQVLDGDRPDELEGYIAAFEGRPAVAVTSSRRQNVHFVGPQ